MHSVRLKRSESRSAEVSRSTSSIVGFCVEPNRGRVIFSSATRYFPLMAEYPMKARREWGGREEEKSRASARGLSITFPHKSHSNIYFHRACNPIGLSRETRRRAVGDGSRDLASPLPLRVLALNAVPSPSLVPLAAARFTRNVIKTNYRVRAASPGRIIKREIRRRGPFIVRFTGL